MAAAELTRRLATRSNREREAILGGYQDGDCYVQAFAHHRIAHSPTPTDPEVAALVERLMEMAASQRRSYIFEHGTQPPVNFVYTAEQAADLITRLSAKLQEADHG